MVKLRVVDHSHPKYVICRNYNGFCVDHASNKREHIQKISEVKYHSQLCQIPTQKSTECGDHTRK